MVGVRASVLMCISLYMLGVSLSVCTHDEGARQCFDVYINLYIESECEYVYT